MKNKKILIAMLLVLVASIYEILNRNFFNGWAGILLQLVRPAIGIIFLALAFKNIKAGKWLFLIWSLLILIFSAPLLLMLPEEIKLKHYGNIGMIIILFSNYVAAIILTFRKTKNPNQILDPTWTTPVLKSESDSQAGQD